MYMRLQMFPWLLLVLLLSISSGLFAQLRLPGPLTGPLPRDNSSNICGNDAALSRLRNDPVFLAREEAMNKKILVASGSMSNDTITLPVVVHVINQNPNNITDMQVMNGIMDLNDAFSKSGNYAASLGADTKIRFCLSQKDPDGGNTPGITRTVSYFSNDLNMDNEDVRLKNLVQWDPSRYINIWLITSIHGEAYADFSCGNWYRLGVGGYATMPPGGGTTDGIVVTGFGSVLAHEMGHYLGLYHTFTGGCYNNNCTTDGDRVCDTPPDNSVRPSASCNSPQSSCNTDTLSNHSNGIFFSDQPDQVSNFMDYGNGSCSNQFTQGQADRMRAAILTQRTGLLQDECNKPCIENIVAGFTRNISYPIPGDMVNFTNISTGAANYEWLVNDVVMSAGTNFSYTFNVTGKYKVTLKAFNTPSCFASSTDFVIINCGVTARFYTNKQTIASRLNVYEDSIIFTNTSYNGVTYQWLMSNDQGMAEQVISTNTQLTYVFPTPANYAVRLIAINGACADTTAIYRVPVMDPTADGAPFNVSVVCYQQTKVKIDFCLADYGYAPLPRSTPINFYDADPRLPTANRLSPTFYLPYDVPGGYCYICFSHILNVAYRGVEKIYMVFNDAGTGIPVGLPNASLLEKNYLNNFQNSSSNRTSISASICQGQNYAGHTATGIYIDTLASRTNGCDSIRTLNLVVRPVFNTVLNLSICQGENYAGHTTSGTFVDRYTAVNGCDSTRTLHLIVKPKVSTYIVAAICQGENYAGHTTTGSYVDRYTAANGCDSTRTLQLTVKPTSHTSVSTSICQGENYAGHTATGTYVDTYNAANGCDSTRTLQLTVRPVYNIYVVASRCQGDNYAGHTTTGTYVDHYTAANGCDSTRTLNLTIKPVASATVYASICEGENYAGHNASGTYIDVYSAANGCDSTRTLHLVVKPIVATTVTATICEGYNYAGHSNSGMYVDVYTAANGCDSTRTLLLTVNPKKFTRFNVNICKGESFLAGGALQVLPGTYYDTAHTYLGCDSILVTQLTVNPLPLPNLGIDRGICTGDTMLLDPGNFTAYLWQDGSITPTYASSQLGSFSVEVTNIFGCKASDTVHLATFYALPKDFLPGDTSLCRGNTVQPRLDNFVSYSWSTGSTNNMISIVKSGTYLLTVKDINGCTGRDSMKVLFYNCVNVQVPNAFTPNNDGANDVFKPLIPAPVTNYSMQVWNKWGQLLFRTEDYKKGWDGTFKDAEQPSAGYVYLILLTDIDGIRVKKYGSLLLVR